MRNYVNPIKHQEKIQKMRKLAEISDEEVSSLNYKERQKYFRSKNMFGRKIFISKDKNGNGVSYRKGNVKDENR